MSLSVTSAEGLVEPSKLVVMVVFWVTIALTLFVLCFPCAVLLIALASGLRELALLRELLVDPEVALSVEKFLSVDAHGLPILGPGLPASMGYSQSCPVLRHIEQNGSMRSLPACVSLLSGSIQRNVVGYGRM